MCQRDCLTDGNWSIQCRPFREGESVAHGHITTRANGYEIIWDSWSSFRFGYIVTGLKIKHVYYICTPTGGALSLERAAVFAKPYLFSEGRWNFLLASLVFQRRKGLVRMCVRGYGWRWGWGYFMGKPIH
jgi:hypothetical protein